MPTVNEKYYYAKAFLFQTFENETSVYCYNLREVRSVLSTLKGV